MALDGGIGGPRGGALFRTACFAMPPPVDLGMALFTAISYLRPPGPLLNGSFFGGPLVLGRTVFFLRFLGAGRPACFLVLTLRFFLS
jgi:hypothetical protein